MWLSQSKVVKELPGSATIKRCAKEFLNQMDLGNITIERTARDCHIQNDCKGVPQSEEMSGVKQLIWLWGRIKLKGILGSITIKVTAREYSKLVFSGIYNNENDCRWAFQLKEMPENIKIKRTVQTNTTGEYHNQKGCSWVLQTKVLPGSVKIKVLLNSITDIFKVLSEYNNKKIVRAYHNPKYC